MSAFEFSPEQLRERLEEIVDETFDDLQSQFLVLPRGGSYLEYPSFQDAYEVLRRNTDGFSYLTEDAVWSALREDSLVLVVLRTILGVSPAEWADLARSELGSDVNQGHARSLDVKVRQDRDLFSRWLSSAENVGLKRAKALISVAVGYIMRGAPEASEKETVHRLASMRDSKIRNGQPGFEVVACIDGRGFGVRRQDMRDMLLATDGKVFTLATLDQLIRYTRLREFLPQSDWPCE